MVGTSLKLFFNGALQTYAFDSTLTTGFTGIWGSGGATLDNFSAAVVTTPQTLPFTDAFTQSDGSQLSPSWADGAGNFSVKSDRARANAPGANLASVILTATASDLAVQADIALAATGSQYAGVVRTTPGRAQATSTWARWWAAAACSPPTCSRTRAAPSPGWAGRPRRRRHRDAAPGGGGQFAQAVP